MFRKVLTLTAIVLVFLACEVQAAVIHSNWDGGEFGYWEGTSNWNPPIEPNNNGNTFAVTIDSNSTGAEEVVVRLQLNHTIDTLLCYGNVNLEGPTWEWVELSLVDANGLTNYGVLGISAWGVELFGIEGNVTNVSGALLDLWGAEIEGNITNQIDATIEANGEVDVDDGNLVNAGLVVIGDHELNIDQDMHNTGQVKIYTGGLAVGGILDNDANAVITGLGFVFAGEGLVNNGRIFATSGDLVLATGHGTFLNIGIIGNAALTALNVAGFPDPTDDANNQGTIEVNAGGGVAFESGLVNEPNGIIKLLGGTLAATTITQTADANFAGFGGITGDVLIDPNGLIELIGPTNIVGDLTIDPNATLEISDGTTLITGHTTCNNGTIHMIGGRVICQGGLTNNNCHIIWEPGTYTNMADFNLDGTVNFKDFADFADTWLWRADWY
ncbi:MAG: autotransporter outer membrane beta-barrel domain-containing protein [Planctomycetota bacterium]|jgi:hypothetical protein